MPSASDFHMQVTAGKSYDSSTHQTVHVNTDQPVTIDSDHLDASVWVKIQHFRGLPENSPSTDAYFSTPPHTSDQYSISFNFRLKKPIPASELVFGNDFEKPIKDKLPPGFGAAMRVVKWGIDPGLDGDVYADKPYLYGPLASSINQLWIGDKSSDTKLSQWHTIEEGGSPDGTKLREEHKVPAAGPQRMKHFLNETHRKEWTFEAGREYRCDFFNGYLDFNDLSLKLPGNFKLHLMSFWDGQPLRYTLKHRTSDKSVDEVLFCVVFTLLEIHGEHKQEEHKSEPPRKDMTGLGGGGGGGGGGAQDDDVD